MSHGAEKDFDAPRPAVTSRLGKKRTDELIRADGDTWQEYLAVAEKANRASSNGPTRGGAFSFFGKRNKKKQSSNSASNVANTNGSGSSNLIIRSYFENRRTGKRVWDEPPSGASNIVPASDEMRRMAELQLGELYVVTRPSAGDVDSGKGNESTKTKKTSSGGGLFRRGNGTSSTSGGTEVSSGSTKSGRRIRYKPNSNYGTTGNRQLQEAIERSMAESYGGVSEAARSGGGAESEEEVLRRVLEESRLEAISSANTRSNNHSNDGYDRKPPARKHPPTTEMGSFDPYNTNDLASPTNIPAQKNRRQNERKESRSSSSSTQKRSSRGGTNPSQLPNRNNRSLHDQTKLV